MESERKRGSGCWSIGIDWRRLLEEFGEVTDGEEMRGCWIF